MKKSHAASVLVAASATVMWMGTAAFAATGFAGHQLTTVGVAAHSVHAIGASVSANKCDRDHDSDDVSCGTSTNKCDGDHDSDDMVCSTGATANKCDGDHDGDDVGCGTSAKVGDGDHDSDDVSAPSRRCGTDRDRDDRTGRPSDHDGDVCGRG